VLQLVVGYMKHCDHNVVTASLEVLHQLLKHASVPLRMALVSRASIASLLTEAPERTHGMYCPTVSFILHVNYKLLLLHPFNGLFSRTTWVSWYQKDKTSLDLNEARDDGVSG